MKLQTWLLRLVHRNKTPDAEEVRRLITARFLNFKQLLIANTEAHELFAELEETLKGGRTYGMQHVRSLCTKISSSIFRMVHNINEMAPQTYAGLFERFQDIQQKINPFLSPSQPERGGPLVLPLSSIRRKDVAQCGAKMSMLGDAAANLSLATPPGFVVTAEGYRRFIVDTGLREEINRRMQSGFLDTSQDPICVSSAIMQMVMAAPLPDDLETAICAAYAEMKQALGSDINLAVRSSALGEDAQGAAFAGQYRSLLNVDADGLLDAYREVVASKWSVEACAYRVRRGIRDDEVAMCVGCMGMVDGKSSGVAYSSSPVNFRDTRVRIYSVWGLPKAVVDGSTTTDEFLVTRKPEAIASSTITPKNHHYICHPLEGTQCVPTSPEAVLEPSLADNEVLAVARLADKLEEYFAHPQDVEWIYDRSGTLLLLQCRPLMESADASGSQQAEGLPDPLFANGSPASPGAACGEIRVVLKDADALSFPRGAVLMLRHAQPRRAALLHKASAVIAEQGSAAGHLANVAREFGVPAVFGLHGILDSLDNGQEVTVDAASGAVYEGRVENLLQAPQKRPDLMEGSPVRTALEGASRHILRLHLLDPDSVKFRARNCQTFHDIMRFCHEKAVNEMFHLGMSRDIQKISARQIICGVPKQFWVLNLDDAFNEEGAKRTDGRINMEQIRSKPMNAIWEGMMAVPWAGPPRVNARGFMSVVFEATTNPNLNAAAGSDYVTRNYFMASRNYCSLQSRFGFHFCGTESYVGERVAENYASFQFKGGAADLRRRVLRAQFIAEFLEGYDFGIRLNQDSLFARVEGLEHDDTLQRLRIIGYLITHTRQIDMIMADPAAVKKRRQTIMNDLHKLTAS